MTTESLSLTISKYKPGSGFGSQDDPLVFVFLEDGSVVTFDETNGIVDELSMCVRYHQSLFRDRKIDRIIFLGGEARNIALCQHIAKELHLPAQLGDPLARLESKRSLRTPGLTLGQPQPGWAVVCGLCMAPTDL